jgi:hypothetical protein
VQAAREAARRTQCSNHLRQLALAVLNYERTAGRLPPSAIVDFSTTSTGNNGSWGVHGRILPFLEQGSLYTSVDVNVGWDYQAAIDGLRVPVYACPSDPGTDRIRDPGGGKVHLAPTTYGFNLGTWFVYNPAERRGGDGVFYPNSFLRMAQLTDGTSHTLLAAEVKAWQPYLRNGGPSATTIPNTPADAAAIVASGAEFKDTGHTEWPDGRVHHSGITATLTPNSRVDYDTGDSEIGIVDADYNSWQEGKNGRAGRPTYAIVTSRSFHAGLVQAVMADSSVRTIGNDIDLAVWRGLATRAGGEVEQGR